MDAVAAEHKFAYALGDKIGQRGTVSDADLIRSGKPENLIKALDKVLHRFKQLAAKLPESDKLKTAIDNAIADLEATKVLVERTRENISPPACLQLWYMAAISVELIATYLSKG
jgi:hypothetical protein